MELDDLSYQKELETAIDAARRAGDIMDEYREKDAEVEKRKLNFNDIATEADRRCQEDIISRLEEEFPGDGILAEEDHLEPDGESRVWVIDPIDGTFNFSKGFPYFCTSIALKVDDEYVLGVVLSPRSALGELYFATEGSGSYMAGLDEEIEEARKISVSSQEFRGSRLVVDYSDMEKGERVFDGDALNRILEEGGAYMRPGAAAVNASMLARGSLDGWLCHCWEWDFAAGKTIIEEAGGEVDLRKIEASGQYEIVASNGVLHQKLLDYSRLEHKES